jgi:hypothetical protein
MTGTIIDHLGATLTGEIRCWMGRRIVEVETPDGARHIGRLTPDAHDELVTARVSAMDGAR